MSHNDKNGKKNMSVIKCLFFVGLTCFVVSGAFGAIEKFENLSFILSVVGIGFSSLSIVLNIISRKLYTEKKILLMIPIILVALLSYAVVRDFTVLRLLLIMLGAMTISFKQVISFDLKIRILVILLVAVLAMLNVIPSGDILRVGGGDVRHALGFAHPNILGMHVLIVTLEANYLFLRYKKTLLLIDTLGILFELLVPNSRMPAIIIGAMMIYVIGGRFINKIISKKVVKFLVTSSFVIFSVVSITFGIVGPSGDFFGGLNRLSSNRIKLYHVAMQTTDTTFLGNDEEHNVHNNVVLDNAYLELLLTFGIAQMLMYMVFSILTYKKLYRKKDYALIWILFLLGWFGMAETAYIYVTVNIFLASYGFLLVKERSDKDE